MSSSERISYADFGKVEMRIGKIIDCKEFPEARKPAYKLKIDFGSGIGVKNSSAQLKARYRSPESLVGRKIIAVVNFPPKQVANFLSEVLVLGVADEDGGIILLRPDCEEDTPLGSRVC